MPDAQMHSYVGVILDAAKMDEDKFIVPTPLFDGFTKQLRHTHLEDTTLFVHLVVAAGRVKKAGLASLAEQLVALAKIGLDHKLIAHQQEAAAARARAAGRTVAEVASSGAGSLPRGSLTGASLRPLASKQR